MLQITIPKTELWDEKKQEFVYTKEQTLQLEHSLVSISKWESKWGKVFLSKEPKTDEETIDYIRCMTITQNVKPETYNYLTPENIIQIDNYIKDPMTATYFTEEGSKGSSRKQVTNELIYHWMIELKIPMQCEKWHLNRLLTLIKVRNVELQPPKKRNAQEIMASNAARNAQRRKRLKSKG